MVNEIILHRAAVVFLAGYIDRKAGLRLIRAMRARARQKPRTRFLLHCSLVKDFSGYALADLVSFRRELQWQGADVELAACSAYVKNRLALPLFESLLAAEPCRSLYSPITAE
jgi:ABC-type transporter Mla MlaB component